MIKAITEAIDYTVKNEALPAVRMSHAASIAERVLVTKKATVPRAAVLRELFRCAVHILFTLNVQKFVCRNTE
jgi:hypothetical protein